MVSYGYVAWCQLEFYFLGTLLLCVYSHGKSFFAKLAEQVAQILFSHFYALLVIIPGWVIFYFSDTAKLGAYFERLFSFGGQLWTSDLTNDITTKLLWLIMAIVLCMPVYHKVHDMFENKIKRPGVFEAVTIGANVLLVFLCVAQLVGKSYNPLIYFRF